MKENDSIIISVRASKKLRSGYPWVYSNDVLNGKSLPEVFAAPVEDAKGNYTGFGVFNKHSLIQVRMLTLTKDADIPRLITDKIRMAYALRKRLYPGFPSFRAFFAESDGLPGLIIDKYEKTLVIEVNSKGMMLFLDNITASCIEIFSPDAIVLKNTASSLKREGLEHETKILYGILPSELIIQENGIRFHVDPMSGQKTGFFLTRKTTGLGSDVNPAEKRFLTCSVIQAAGASMH